MQITLVTPAAGPLLTKTQCRAHLRHVADGQPEESPSFDDGVVSAYLAAATSYVEAITNRALMASAWKFEFDCFPCEDRIYIPRGKPSSVVVKYVPEGGSLTTLAGAEYIVKDGGSKGVGAAVVLNQYKFWPTDILRSVNGVEVTFNAGWATADDVPEPIKQAVRLLLGHFYERREATGPPEKRLEFAVDALLAPYKLSPLWAIHD